MAKEANIVFSKKGSFKKVTGCMERLLEVFNIGILDKYGRLGVEALKKNTPKVSSLTANSWYYEIKHGRNSATLYFCNSNIQNGVLVAVLLLYGHATVKGTWTPGNDYITEAIKPVFEDLFDEIRREIRTK